MRNYRPIRGNHVDNLFSIAKFTRKIVIVWKLRSCRWILTTADTNNRHSKNIAAARNGK